MMRKYISLLSLTNRSLFSKYCFNFSKAAKNRQVILYTRQQIEKMAVRKQEKDKGKENPKKQWKMNAGGGGIVFRVSLVGLPNSGKSSLFNCLIGENIAIVDKHYGMTRDRKQFPILKGLASIIDTPGIQVKDFKRRQQTELKQDIFKQSITAIHESDLILLVIDSAKPITQDEIEFAQYLKAYRKNAEIVLICNKCDGLFDEGDVLNQASKLGINNIRMCSSYDGQGILEILNLINQNIPQKLKQEYEKRRQSRLNKFEEIVTKLKAEIQSFNEGKDFKIKNWEHDFRMINKNPEDNSDLDYQNSEDYLIKPEQTFSNTRGAEAKNIRLKNTIKICFIGRPNVGKSTLINQIIGTDKMITSETPHTTRDSIRSKIEYKSRKIQLIDTAGLNTPNIRQTDEQYLRKVQNSTMAHVKESHVVVYVMDAFEAFKIDDFAFIQKIIEEGRPVIIAVNKWEAVKEAYRYKAKNYLLHQLQRNLGQVHGDPLVFVSAKLQMNIDEMMDKIVTTYDKWNTRISTGLLNDWLDNFKKLSHLPKVDEKELKINYLIQARVRPPLFIFFINAKALFQPHYMRFIMRNMAKQFGLDGIPLRHTLRSTNNGEKKYAKSKTDKKKVNPTRQKMEELKKKYGNFGL